MDKRGILPIITVFILLLIIGISVTIRGSLAANDDLSISALRNSREIIKKTELNEAERTVLAMLSDGEGILKYQREKNQTMYLNYLEEYFSYPKVDLSKAAAVKIADKIKKMKMVMKIENENDWNKISLVGRGLIINLSEEIYKLCGIKLVYNLSGSIIQISDNSGNYSYFNTGIIQQADFRLNDLIIILATIVILFSLCVFTAKKNHLFIKEEVYDECNSKGF